MIRYRVLVIEDNEQNMYMISYLLERAGFDVIQASDGISGLTMAKTHLPDLIILDIQLPKLDGYEVARRLGAEPSLVDVPIVAVTSFAMVGDRERILEAGCRDYIEKPIDPVTFVESVTHHIADGRRKREEEDPGRR